MKEITYNFISSYDSIQKRLPGITYILSPHMSEENFIITYNLFNYLHNLDYKQLRKL